MWERNFEVTFGIFSVSVMQVSISSIFIPPPGTPEICTKNLPHPEAFAFKLLPGGGRDLLGQLPRDKHLSINDVCHF